MELDIDRVYSIGEVIQYFITGVAVLLLIIAIIFIVSHIIRGRKRPVINSNMASYVKYRLDDMSGRKRR